MARYSLEERIFIYENYIKTKSVKKCRKRYKKEYPLGKVPSKSAILQLIKRVKEKGTVWKSNESHRPEKTVLTEEKMDEIGAQLEQCPEKSLARMAQEANISESSAWRATKLLLRTASEFKVKLKEVKSEANQEENDNVEQMNEVYIPEAPVKVEKMDQEEEEEEEEQQQFEEKNIKKDVSRVKEENETVFVKEEPQSEDEEINEDYLPTLNIEDVKVKKEEIEEHNDTEVKNFSSL